MADRDDQYTFNKCMRLSKNKKYNFKMKRIKRNQNSNQIIPNQKESGYVILSRKVPKQTKLYRLCGCMHCYPDDLPFGPFSVCAQVCVSRFVDGVSH